MSTKIVDAAAKPLQACAQFPFRGFDISLSTIFTPTEVAVFKGNELIGTFVTIERAVDAVLAMEAAKAALFNAQSAEA